MRRRNIAPGLILVLVLTSLSFKCDGGGSNSNSTADPIRKYAKALDDMAGGINAMIKVKSGGKLWSKTTTGQIDEALLKVLCHNICVLVQSIYELNIAPIFWGNEAVAATGT